MVKNLLTLAARAARVDDAAQRTARYDYAVVYQALLARLRQRFGDRLSGIRVLDFGCGYRYPNVVLLSRDVGEMVGVEVAPLFRDGWRAPVMEPIRRRKLGTALESVLDYSQAARYYRHLERLTDAPVQHEAYRIARYDGSRLPFEDGSFDCVISNAVLQELPLPMERFAREIARVLRPGGSIDLEWHNFHSLSGNYRDPADSRREPWGHLLGGYYHPSLNRLSPAEMRHAFSPWFEELETLGHDREYRLSADPGFTQEGEELLSPELARRLEEYPREWLVTRGYILQGVVSGEW